MKYLYKYDESNKITIHTNKITLLKDIFGDFDLDFNIHGIIYSWAGQEEDGKKSYISVIIELEQALTREMVNEIIRLTNMAEKYCDLEFSIWSINTYAGSLINRSLRRGSDKPTGGKAPKDCIESMVDVLISGGTGNKIDGILRRYSDDTVGTVVIEFSYND